MGSAEILVLCIMGVGSVLPVILIATAIRVVPEDKRLAVYRLGRYLGDKGPGLIMLIPIIDRGIVKDVGLAGQAGGSSAGKLHARFMIGWGGEATTRVFRDGGQVLLHTGESVDAISEMPIQPGQPVRVKRVILEVESVD
jgi:hypothetical protein